MLLTALAGRAQTNLQRVALMDFSTDDNSYHSTQLAADFTGLLQAGLAGEPEVEWVERAQLDKAREELEISAAELVSGGASIQRGKWVKADCMITGQFSSNDKNERTLFVEIVDLKHADTLASETIIFPEAAATPFQTGSNEVNTAISALRRLLPVARRQEQQAGDKILVAPLFLAEITGPGSRFGFLHDHVPLEQEFNAALERATATNGRVQLIRFPKAYRSIGESEMVLDGLVATDRNAWQQTADLYVWGTYAATNDVVRGGQPEERVEIILHLWDGVSPPDMVTAQLPDEAQPEQVRAAIERLANQVVAAAHKHRTQVDSDAIRKGIAQSLVKTYDQLTMSFHHREELGLNDPEKFSQAVHMLETACFFDPDNAEARVLYITCRWGWWMDFGFKVKNQFWSKWRRSEALGKYVNRFGLKPVTEELPFPYQQEGGIPEMYLRSLADVSAMFPQWHSTNEMALENEDRRQGVHTWLMEAEYHGFPKEMPLEDAWKWKTEVQAENWRRLFNVTKYVSENGALQEKTPAPVLFNVIFSGMLDSSQEPAMRLKALEKIWPFFAKYAQAHGRQWIMGAGTLADEREQMLTDLCNQAGEPDRARQLLAMLSSNQTIEVARPAPSLPPAERQNISSMTTVPAWLEKDNGFHSLFRLSPPVALPPEVKPEFQEIHFPARYEIQSVLQLGFLRDQLLILAMDERSAQTSDANPGLAAELLDKHNRLWVLDPGATSPILYAPDVFSENVRGFLLKDGQLWVAGKTTGYLDLETHAFHKSSLSDGLIFQETSAIGLAGGSIFASSDDFKAARYDPASNRWNELPSITGGLSRSGEDNFMLTGNQRWLNLAQKDTSTLIYDTVAGVWQNLSDKGAIECSVAVDPGFWFGSRNGLHFYDPATQSFKHWGTPPTVESLFTGLFYMGNSEMPRRELEKLEENIQTGIKKIASEHQKRQKTRLAGGAAIDPLHLDCRVFGEVTAIADDGEFLWLGVEAYSGSHLLLMHKPSNSLVAGFAMPVRDTIKALAITETSIWAGTSYGDHKLLKISKAAFLAVPKSRWVNLAISPEERAQLIKSMSTRDRAMYAFYAGDDASVAKLLGGVDPDKASLEEMFMLLICYDALGADQPDLMRKWADQIGSRFPDSPWAKAAQTALAENEKNHETRQHEASVLAKYDLNHDGVLNAEEMLAMEKDPAYKHEAQGWNDIQLGYQLQEIMKRYDRNGDGRLDRMELNILRTQVLLFCDAPPAMLAGKKVLLAPLLTKNFPGVDTILKKYDPSGTGTVNLDGLKALAKDIQNN